MDRASSIATQVINNPSLHASKHASADSFRSAVSVLCSPASVASHSSCKICLLPRPSNKIWTVSRTTKRRLTDHMSLTVNQELDVKLAGVSMQMVSDELQAEGHKNEETHHCQQNVSLPCDGSHKIDWSNLTMPRLMKTSEV